MNLNEIRELILLLDRTSIAELEIKSDDFKLSLRKGVTSDYKAGKHDTPADNIRPAFEQKVEDFPDENIVSVTAPMVGTFYSASSPDAEPFVRVGDNVTKGQTLCIVEAMKLMNEIKSEYEGTIVDIAVENTQVIEYDQLMFVIKKN